MNFKEGNPWKLLTCTLLVCVFMSPPVRGDIVSYILHKVSAWQDLETALAWARPYFTTAKQGMELKADIENKSRHVRFFLYTDQQSLSKPDQLVMGDWDTFYYSRFNPANPVKFFIHGFGQNYKRPFPQEAIKFYIEEGYAYNLIAVDWGALSMNSSVTGPVEAFTNYLAAFDNVPIVGQTVGNFIYYLYYYQLTTLDKVHIVGFSLGAQVSGWAGARVKNYTGSFVSRISGLDPAGPLYRTGEMGRHLTKNDSAYVDMIHTDMSQSGTVFNYGHADFYVNGGFPPQPGCLYDTLKMGFSDAIPIVLSGSCSHNKAPIYWDLSIRKNESLMARQCTGYAYFQAGKCSERALVPFGERSQPWSRGKFYVEIDSNNKTEEI